MVTMPNAFERQVSQEKNGNSQRMIWTAAAMDFSSCNGCLWFGFTARCQPEHGHDQSW